MKLSSSGVCLQKEDVFPPRKRRRTEQDEHPTKDEGLGGEKNEGLSPTTDRLSRLSERSSPATAFHSHLRGGLSA
ncbi:MAG: hypothetical protein EHM72_14950 [Calditrichaeota bacterium]|nr:MAG: hypothetical protein EHM72_14950 [Calditrichota bacterium]